MNAAQWHLLLTHLPLVGLIIGTLILIAGYLLKNNPTVKLTALGVFVFAALCAIPVYLTGEGAEDLVEKIPGISKNVIEHHEDLGKTFMIVISVLGITSLATFFFAWTKSRAASALYAVVLIMAVASSIFAKQVGTSGGEIRHTEIRNNGSQPTGDMSGEKHDEDDD